MREHSFIGKRWCISFMEPDYLVRRAEERHVDEIARINNTAFTQKKNPEEWIRRNMLHFPRFQYFVADSGLHLLGYILWSEKSGYRPKPIIELEAMAVDRPWHGNGIGAAIVTESFRKISDYYLMERKAPVERVVVTTGEDNLAAQRLYEKTLGARIEAVIPDLFSGKNEVIMVARRGNGVI